MNTDEKISSVLVKYGAFWAFGDKQFLEQKKDGVKYASLGAGLLCPVDQVDNFVKELNKTTKDAKKEEKEKRQARAKGLKNAMLPEAERIQNRKILITEAISRINNFMDDSFVAEHYRMIENSTKENITEVIDSAIKAIEYRYHDRAFEPEVKECYDENIKIIKTLKDEIITI